MKRRSPSSTRHGIKQQREDNMMLKIMLWLPYVLSQAILILIIIGVNIHTNISEQDSYILGSFIALYGALIVISSDLRRKWWPRRKTQQPK